MEVNYSFSFNGESPVSDLQVPPEARQFDFLLGEWDCEGESFKPDGSSLVRYKARWNAKAIDDGRMIVDEFRSLDLDGRPVAFVVTLRTYREATRRWELATLFSGQPAAYVTDFNGEARDGEMWLRAASRLPSGGVAKATIRFFDIRAESFDWENTGSVDDGVTWTKVASLSATRARREPVREDAFEPSPWDPARS